MNAVQPGIEVLRAADFSALRGKRVGLLTNPSAVDHDLVSTYGILRHAPNVTLRALFSPEHGLWGTAEDGKAVPTSRDPRTDLPVYSLYGPTQRPTPEMFAGLDALVCDIQDIGVRNYTFTWTVSHALEAAGELGLPIIILDRPNPLGDTVYGAPLDPAFASMVGRFPVPNRHGMTLGELIRLFNAMFIPKAAPLTVIPCAGYRRTMFWTETGLPFVPPSPNMPHLVTAQHYVGSCLVEGTTLSEGRGTALPFEIVGAPDLDGFALANTLNAQGWPGVRFRPHAFQPTARRYQGKLCHGVQAHITDRRAYEPLSVWLRLLAILHKDGAFTWEAAHFDRLVGSDSARNCIDRGALLDDLFQSWANWCWDFEQRSRPFLLYD